MSLQRFGEKRHSRNLPTLTETQWGLLYMKVMGNLTHQFDIFSLKCRERLHISIIMQNSASCFSNIKHIYIYFFVYTTYNATIGTYNIAHYNVMSSQSVITLCRGRLLLRQHHVESNIEKSNNAVTNQTSKPGLVWIILELQHHRKILPWPFWPTSRKTSQGTLRAFIHHPSPSHPH